MMNKINAMLMTLDEMGYTVERIMDCYVMVYNAENELVFESNFNDIERIEKMVIALQ